MNHSLKASITGGFCQSHQTSITVLVKCPLDFFIIHFGALRMAPDQKWHGSLLKDLNMYATVIPEWTPRKRFQTPSVLSPSEHLATSASATKFGGGGRKFFVPSHCHVANARHAENADKPWANCSRGDNDWDCEGSHCCIFIYKAPCRRLLHQGTPRCLGVKAVYKIHTGDKNHGEVLSEELGTKQCSSMQTCSVTHTCGSGQ